MEIAIEKRSSIAARGRVTSQRGKTTHADLKVGIRDLAKRVKSIDDEIFHIQTLIKDLEEKRSACGAQIENQVQETKELEAAEEELGQTIEREYWAKQSNLDLKMKQDRFAKRCAAIEAQKYRVTDESVINKENEKQQIRAKKI